MRLALRDDEVAGLFVPSGLLCVLLVIILAQLGVLTPVHPGPNEPETVTVPARAFSYRAEGDFQQDGRPVDGPLVTRQAPALEIMRYQVTVAQYDACVAAGACAPAAPAKPATGPAPVTGVSYEDASDYAAWLSARTSGTWRLPTIAEWVFAAGRKASDPALRIATDTGNPADRWIAAYEQESRASAERDVLPHPPGTFGFNEYGLADLAANVWEWTNTCARRSTLDATGALTRFVESCGIRYLEGPHRAPMSVFIRDARGGGCSVGLPPTNLGFRLIREPAWYARLATALRLGG